MASPICPAQAITARPITKPTLHAIRNRFAPNIFVPPLEVGRYAFHLFGMGEQWGPRPLVPESGTFIPPELVFRSAILHLKVNYEPIAVATGEVHPMEIFRRRRGS